MSSCARFFLGSLCAAAVLVCAPGTYAQDNVPAAFRFSVVSCDEKLKWIELDSGPAEGILRKYWRPDGVFVVEYFVKADCSGASFSGDYEVRDSLLVLKRALASQAVRPRCLCAHRLLYEFSGLPRRDYSVALESTQ